MSFKIKPDLIDFGTISIENIFINDFMPMANGTDVKIYLLGYKYANEANPDMEISNMTIAKHLSLSMEDVLRAWDFWEKRGIIVKTPKSDAIGDYDVEFLSLRQLYIDNNFSQVGASQPVTVTVNDLLDSTKNPEFTDMFYHIDQLMRRPLQPNQRQEVLKWFYEFNFSPEMILKAFMYAIEVKGVKNLNYTRSILTSWYDQGILTPEDADHHMATDSKSYASYRAVYKTLGFVNRTVNAGDKEIIDKWLGEMGLSLEFVIEVLKERATRTSNVSMKYMDASILDLFQRGVRSISAFQEDLKQHQESLAQKKAQKNESKPGNGAESGNKTPNKNKFHQFEQSKTGYTDKDLDKLLRNRR